MLKSESLRHKDGIRILNRREVLQQVTALVAVAASGSVGRMQAQQTGAQMLRFFPGFQSFRLDGDGAVINGVIGGQGPPYCRCTAHPRPMWCGTWSHQNWPPNIPLWQPTCAAMATAVRRQTPTTT